METTFTIKPAKDDERYAIVDFVQAAIGQQREVTVNGEPLFTHYGMPVSVCQNGTVTLNTYARSGNKPRLNYFKPGTQVTLAVH